MFGNLFSIIAGDCKAMLPFIFTGTYKEIIHNLQGAILLGYLIFYYYYRTNGLTTLDFAHGRKGLLPRSLVCCEMYISH